MNKVTYEIVEVYENVDRYWTGDGFCTYERASFRFEDINDAKNVARCLLTISKIQDGKNCLLKYYIYTITDDTITKYMEVTE